MGKLLHIGMVVFLGVMFISCTYLMYRVYKNTIEEGKRLIDKPVNNNKRTEKIKIGEIFVYILMFVIAILFVMQIIYKGAKFPSATAVIIRTVILVPIMALFNARKRTGKAVVALFASLLFLLFCTMTYMIIGLPVKAPVLTVNSTEIRLGQTTVREIMDAGFDIYTGQGQITALDLQEFPDSEEFQKYYVKTDISIPRGYHRYDSRLIPHCRGILVKNNSIIAELIFHGSMTKETKLRDCSIIDFNMNRKYIAKVRNTGMTIKLNGVDLISRLETEKMKKIFGRRIIRPNQIEAEKHYIISWYSNSHHLFFNSYTASIHMDDNYLMNDIEVECQIAREADQ